MGDRGLFHADRCNKVTDRDRGLAQLAEEQAGGWELGLAGLWALRERTLDVDLLTVVAALGAAAIEQGSTVRC